MSSNIRQRRAEDPGDITVPDPGIRPIALAEWGTLLWAVALVVVLLVPELHTGEREWWVWVPVAGVASGMVGTVYLALGRGNARFA